MWKKRSEELEILDLGPSYYSTEEYEDCLIKLDRVGRWLGGDRATFSAIENLKSEPTSILDVGCGGGLFTIKMAERYPQTQVIGSDINSQAIDFARRRVACMQNPPKNISFECPDHKNLDLEKNYDVIVATLVCHHMTDQELIQFITSATQMAKKKVIINDLHRHPLAFYLFKAMGPLLFKNRLVQHDGPLSVLRSFTYKDWTHLLKQAKVLPSQSSIQWKFAFRWLVEINTMSMK